MREIDRKLLRELVLEWGEAKVYYVGGCVRDLLLGVEPKDYDLCIDLENGAALFIDFLKQNHSSICSGFTVFPRYGTSRFNLLGEQIECVMPRTETYKAGPRKPDQVEYAGIYEDALRRDFCCNALYMDIETGEILDPTGKGREDLEGRILRTPLDPDLTFTDDPLRMLRAFRFAAVKGFKIDSSTKAGIHDRSEYRKLSMERVWSEFSKILVSENPSNTIRELHDTGLLEYIIPELEESWGFDQNSVYHNLNLTEHIFKVLDSVRPDLTLRTAALLHDIGKYRNHEVKEDGHYSYHKHEIYSAEMSKYILGRLRCSSAFISDVCVLVQNHMRLKQWTGKRKTVRKMIRELGDNLDMALELIDADNNAHSPEHCILGQIEKFKEAMKKEEGPYLVPITGRQVMERLGISEGKEVGKALMKMQDWYDSDPRLSVDDLIKRYGSLRIQY